MTPFDNATRSPSPGAAIALGVLADATDGRIVLAESRVIASPDRYNPDEGLALLDAYVSISDTTIRQALLDLVLSISGATSCPSAGASIVHDLGDP